VLDDAMHHPIEPPGEVIEIGGLNFLKARQFAAYIGEAGEEVFAKLHQVRRVNEPNREVVVFSVMVERPQSPVHPLEREERLAALFNEADNYPPEVISLRSNFPVVPHTNLREKGRPISICLYDQPYEIVRLTWTPADFLKRIHFWLAHTATGTLHGEDQPLEPLLAVSPHLLVVPAGFNTTDQKQSPKPFNLILIEGAPGQSTLRAIRGNGGVQPKCASVAAVFWCQPQTHGVIKHQPRNLQELQDLSVPAGLDMAEQIQNSIRAWFLDKPTPEILSAQFVIILVLPKTRGRMTEVESIETRAFLTGISVGELGRRLGCLDTHGASSGMIIGKINAQPNALEKTDLSLLQVVHALSRKTAAQMNGTKPCESKIIAVGMGALGSQVYNNLARAGYGRWTLIDNDILLPHNCARHYLGDWAVGTNKARTMAEIGKMILNDFAFAEAIPADLLRPGPHAGAVDAAFKAAEVALDFSASVAVSRYLAESESCPRVISAFMTPNGNGLVVAAEDEKREIRLDWLEMLHYRAVLNEPVLKGSLQSNDSHLRYGNSCRDVSFVLEQDDVCMWAGIASKAIKQMVEAKESSLRIYFSDQIGVTGLIQPPLSVPRKLRLGEWTICVDEWILEKLHRFRVGRLPNETGGILLGAFDTQSRVCLIIDALPSPPDSTEWPTSYIRGCEGLAAQVAEIRKLTLDQVRYVGEWHSHPKGASTQPSGDDLRAYQWLVGHMRLESLPGLMLIVGDRKRICFVQATSRS
jgi:hypothetical protein